MLHCGAHSIGTRIYARTSRGRVCAQSHNFRVDAHKRTVWLSEILKFYTEDFVPVPASSLIAYANRYAPQAAPLDYAVRFTPYDWTVANSQRSKGP